MDAPLVQIGGQGFPRKARDKAQGGVLHTQLLQYAGHIDAFTAKLYQLGGGAVGLARCQSRQTHDVVYGRIKRNCVDHSNPFQIWVCWGARERPPAA